MPDDQDLPHPQEESQRPHDESWAPTLMDLPSEQPEVSPNRTKTTRITGLLVSGVLLGVLAFMAVKSIKHQEQSSITAAAATSSFSDGAGLPEPDVAHAAEIKPDTQSGTGASSNESPAEAPSIAAPASTVPAMSADSASSPGDVVPDSQAIPASDATYHVAPDAQVEEHGAEPAGAMGDTQAPVAAMASVALTERLDRIEGLLQDIKSQSVANAASAAQAVPPSAVAAPSVSAAKNKRPASVSTTPAAPHATPPMSGQLVSVDRWGGVPSVVLASGLPGDSRLRVLREGDVYNGVVLLTVDAQAKSATFGSVGGHRSFTLHVNQGG